MVKISGNRKDLTRVDLSIMPSLRCNLACTFCMYAAGPKNALTLDVEQTRRFLETVDWGIVPVCGFYGGEPSVDLDLYGRFIALIPPTVERFVITNGSWTRGYGATPFLGWCADHHLRLIISGTPEHKRHQDAEFIELLRAIEGVRVKDDDEIHPMGRAATADWTCTRKCTWHEYGVRLGIFPTGDVLLQNCDGVYPVVGSIFTHSFAEVFKVAVLIRQRGCERGCLNLNDLLKTRRKLAPEVYTAGTEGVIIELEQSYGGSNDERNPVSKLPVQHLNEA